MQVRVVPPAGGHEGRPYGRGLSGVRSQAHAAFFAGSAEPFRYFSRKSRIAFQEEISFLRLVKPWPSSGKTTYSTGTLFFLTASTISSDSGLMTRGSLAPWST